MQDWVGEVLRTQRFKVRVRAKDEVHANELIGELPLPEPESSEEVTVRIVPARSSA